MNIFQREPAIVIGLVLSIVALAAQQALSSGIVSGAGVQWANFLISFLPLAQGLITRAFVSPAVTS